jgi:small-conductance mechanosensitive channel
LRARLKRAFDANGIEIPFPQRTVWLRHEQQQDEPPAPTTEVRFDLLGGLSGGGGDGDD